MIKYQVSILRFLTLFLILSGCSKSKTETPLFQKINAESSGVNFINTVRDTKELSILDYLYYYNGGGVAAGDVNNDGLTDLFFVSNQDANKLYLNKGKGINFEDVSAKAGIAGKSNWKTGVTMVDINGDGWLDIYVCAVSNYKKFQGHNELFVNNQNGTFSEKSKEYGLDFQGFATDRKSVV